MTTYLSGPMTGIPELNHPVFHAAAEALRASGWDVVNPAEINADHTRSWDEYMRRDIRALMGCDSIALLPGWMDSKGARLERHIAVQLGMAVHDVETLLAEVAA